ncbi:unnamed protein product [Brassicogethes aeneus]|uniref:tRNA-splicing endonuclease subunit Sen15 domain-containing protein n=1 Tax=Brassicogethes aeneus TaxID=1431903 RepID=A0A9P0AMI9_BRAAE|nr:unnamed protein product [Brassicogethes aeneus]
MNSVVCDLQNKGCGQKEAVLALQVYLELCEIKKYWNIDYHFEDISGAFLTGSKTKSSLKDCFIPLPTSKVLNFMKIQELLQIHKEYNRTFLVFVSEDSTTVYYQIADGLTEITDTQAKHLKEDKHEIINHELRRNQKALEEAALYGTPISLSRKLKQK